MLIGHDLRPETSCGRANVGIPLQSIDPVHRQQTQAAGADPTGHRRTSSPSGHVSSISSPAAASSRDWPNCSAIGSWPTTGNRTRANDQPLLHRLQPAAGLRGPRRLSNRPSRQLNGLPPKVGWVTRTSVSSRRRTLRHQARPDVLHAQKRHADRRHSRANRRLEGRRTNHRDWKRRVCWRRWFIRLATAATRAACSRGFTMAGADRRAPPCIASPPICGSTCRCFGTTGRRTSLLRGCPGPCPSGCRRSEVDIAYLDPPYNQHPYGSNYHVLNSVVLWDKPPLSKQITPRHEGRDSTRLAHPAPQRIQLQGRRGPGLRRLLDGDQRQVYTDQLQHRRHDSAGEPVRSNVERGQVSVVMQGYKRYRVSSQRFRETDERGVRLVVDTHRKSDVSAAELQRHICRHEADVLGAIASRAVDFSQ